MPVQRPLREKNPGKSTGNQALKRRRNRGLMRPHVHVLEESIVNSCPGLPDMLAVGSASGCDLSTSCRGRAFHDSLTLTCMMNSDSSDSACAIAMFRGRTHDALSESRMREIRTSGLTSGRCKRSHGSDCNTGKRRKPPATVKPRYLPPPRHLSTLLTDSTVERVGR